jgi:rod shape-determining protein MreD
MNPYLAVALAFVAVLLDVSMAPGAAVFGVRPSLVVVLVGLWAALRPDVEVMVLAPTAGVLLGLLGNEPLGVSVLALTPIVLLGLSQSPRTSERRFLFAIVLVITGSLAYVFVYTLAARLQGAPAPVGLGVLRVVILAALLNGLLAAVLYWPLARTAPTAPVRSDLRRY